MIVRGIEIEVDVREEIERYEWRNVRDKGVEFVCCSPFRDERHASFSINLETGLWIDFGSYDDHWKKGNLVRLLAWLEDTTEEDIEDSLLEGYGYEVEDDDFKLEINLDNSAAVDKIFTDKDVAPFMTPKYEYLEGRGISRAVQDTFGIGYDGKGKGAVAFFWRDAFTGAIINIKFRSIHEKKFYYADGGQQVKNHLYGLWDALQAGHDDLYLVESEIDALYLWSVGIPAIALGGSFLSESQKDIIVRSGIESLVIATDNDDAGNRVRRQIRRELGGDLTLLDLMLPEGADVNDLSPDQLKDVPRTKMKYKFL